jgi:hypothetical protein
VGTNSQSLAYLEAAFDVLTIRDEKLTPALSRAMAIVQTGLKRYRTPPNGRVPRAAENAKTRESAGSKGTASPALPIGGRQRQSYSYQVTASSARLCPIIDCYRCRRSRVWPPSFSNGCSPCLEPPFGIAPQCFGFCPTTAVDHRPPERRRWVESGCGAVVLGRPCRLPPLSSGGALAGRP